ncbi:hypothetical protein Hanom_Chr00s174776g01830091 [Helianthus anomalus]
MALCDWWCVRGGTHLRGEHPLHPELAENAQVITPGGLGFGRGPFGGSLR